MEPEETNTTEAPEIHYRDFQIESGNTEAKTVEMSVSSEAPVTRMWGGVEGQEILDHSDNSINLERFEKGSAPLLMDHDPTRQIGVIDSIRFDTQSRKLRANCTVWKFRGGKRGLCRCDGPHTDQRQYRVSRQ